MDNLREDVMINQFVLAAGCSRDQASQILSQSGWQFQIALSVYFQEAAVVMPPKGHAAAAAGFSLLTPANTPATPPNFPEALTMLSNLSTSDHRMATSPAPAAGSHFHHHLSPRSHQFSGSHGSPKHSNVFASSSSNKYSPPPPMTMTSAAAAAAAAAAPPTPSSSLSTTTECQFPIDNNTFLCPQNFKSNLQDTGGFGEPGFGGNDF